MNTLRVFLVMVCLVASLFAQAPTGSVGGTVTDAQGAVIPNSKVTVTSRETGSVREVATNHVGQYSVPSLPAGVYEVKVDSPGFATRTRIATVQVGATTSVDFQLKTGPVVQEVSVDAVAPQISYDRHTIDGVVTTEKIENSPLNGRSFLSLAVFNPGVTVSTGSAGQYNRQTDVNILGEGSERVRITVDGATVNDSVTGGTQQNFSQEVIQEFQVSSTNFDLSTGITGSGAVNVVTKSGGNDFHGAGFFYFRDHNMSAYPYLVRDVLHPDPFFARRQSGFTLSGPIVKEKLFFFTSYEHNNQQGVFPAQPTSPEFAAFATNFGSPYIGNQFTTKIDYRTAKHSAFLRYSHDGNHGFAPRSTNTQPSNWVKNKNWADSGVFSVTSAFTSKLINEFRYSMTFWSNKNDPTSTAECSGGPTCIGVGGPQFTLVGISGFSIGNTTNAPQSRVLRRHIFADNVSWTRGNHGLKFGGEWEYSIGTGTYAYAEPAAAALFSPDIVRLYNSNPAVPAAFRLPLPAAFNTIGDVLKLPVAGFSFGLGDINQPPSFDRDQATKNNRYHVYVQDSWRMNSRFTLNFGLAWSYESNLVNSDLPKPQYLAPLFGGNVNATEPKKHDFSPSLGFAYVATKDKKTVIRGGAGIYYDTYNVEKRLIERAIIGPIGTGRVLLSDTSFFSTIFQLAGFGSLPAPLQPKSLSAAPTSFSGAQFVAVLPAFRAGVAAQLGQNNTNTNLAVRNINVFKTGSDVLSPDFVLPYSEHVSIGVQRELRQDLVLSVDFVHRLFLHQDIRGFDFNHFNSFRGPVIPRCTSTAQSLDPTAQCSTGPIQGFIAGASSNYNGMLLKLDKRMSHKYGFTVAYAFASRVGLNGVSDYDNLGLTNGPQSGHQTLNVSGTAELPWKVKFSLISAFGSQGPFEPTIASVDLTGNGLNTLPLPGAGYNQFNMSLGTGDLPKLVQAFNSQYAGKTTSRGQLIPTIGLPASYAFGRNFNSQDVRLSRAFTFKEKYTFTIIGEAFNLFNYANLGGFGSTLPTVNAAGVVASNGFGVPNSRAGNIFGTGGPRAFQVAGRFSF